jgi:hypothetical protein
MAVGTRRGGAVGLARLGTDREGAAAAGEAGAGAERVFQ